MDVTSNRRSQMSADIMQGSALPIRLAPFNSARVIVQKERMPRRAVLHTIQTGYTAAIISAELSM